MSVSLSQLEVQSCSFSKYQYHYHYWSRQASALQSVCITVTVGGVKLQLFKESVSLLQFENNLECGLYKIIDEFSDDMQLLYQNCYLYTEPDTEIYKMAKQLQEYFEKTIETTKSDKQVGMDSHTENSSPGKEMASTINNLQLKVKSIKGVYHWSGDENMTKYDISLVMAEVFSLPSDHIQPDKKPSPGASRPFNSQLSCQRLKDLGIAKNSQFKSKILVVLKSYYKI
ncbi:unnamed protein product [Mytilus coruscus]|uniref:Methionine adenosyltransferase 2 subunit beta n=1 Tax=Mytilus coruscus TaxID=42192 RepID=A0A6J8D492_MYTCO|nr:unnamed protein product [Mytilus coruscus]